MAELVVDVPKELWLSSNAQEARPMTDAETTRAIAAMLDDGEEDQMTIAAFFTIKGEPQSKARPRFTSKGRAYTPAKTKTAEDQIKAAYLNVARRIERDGEASFRVEADFYSGTRQRRDVDNMLKLILDGLNGIAWPDDVQVLEVSGRKVFVDTSEARTEVSIFRLAGGMDRPTQPCIRCGKPFLTYASWKSNPNGKKYCSTECAYAHRIERRQRTCERCGKEFLAHGASHERRFCSTDCWNAHGKVTIPCVICGTEFVQYRSWAEMRPCCSPDCSAERARRKAKERRTKTFPGTCLICGRGTTRKEYKRCNPCKLAGRQAS